MNIEELRINKQLLKEISKRKKEKIYNSQEKAVSMIGDGAEDQEDSAAIAYQWIEFNLGYPQRWQQQLALRSNSQKMNI